MRGRGFGALLLVAGVIAAACESSHGDGNRGSETHWLEACDSDESCGGSLRCICGACTLPCTQSADCLDLGAIAACAPPSVVELVCPGGSHRSSLCLASCDIQGACSKGGTCVDGVCSTRGAPSSDAGRDAQSPSSGMPEGGSAPRKDAGPPRVEGGLDAAADSGTRDASLDAGHDASLDSGPTECRPGFHVVSSGACKPILFSDDFEDGKLPSQWQLWRRAFVETSGRIEVEDGPPRTGFNYGAAGNGRGGFIATHIDDTTWTDYRLDLDAEVQAPGSYNPYGLSCTRRIDLYFRVQEMSESWNEPETAYGISLQTKSCDQDVLGTVALGSLHGYYCPGIGWGCSTAGEGRALLNVVSKAVVDGPNHYTVEVVGKRITFWVNGTQVFDYTDDVVPYPSGTSPVTHGGIGAGFIWELLGWADNVVVTDMR